MQHCLRHMEEPGTGECRHCHGSFCARCLVYSFGPKKPPFCVGCALVASGVRSGHRPVYNAPATMANEPAPFDTAPPLYADSSHRGPGEPPSGGGASSGRSVKSSWSTRRAQRQAAKAGRRNATELPNASGAPSGPLDASELEPLEPLLSATDRKALGRLSASNF